MFSLSSLPIDEMALANSLADERAGAQVAFRGLVRNHNNGDAVEALEYEVFHELALSEAQKIIAEAVAKYNIYHATCVHREGKLELGETAVWVGVSSAHRDASFKAARYIIDEIKHRLPIWKKEYYLGKEPEWVDCRNCSASLTFNDRDYYDRQIKLIGPAAQKTLGDTRALIVGTGGLGAAVGTYLAGAGVGVLGLCDGDLLEVSNLHRQPLYSYKDLGLPKAELAKQRLVELNPYVDFKSLPQYVNSSNVCAILADYHLVFDCTDDLASKYLLHDACFLLKKPLVQAGIYGSAGELKVFTSEYGCLRCYQPELPDLSCVGNCSELGVIGAVAGVLGTMQAASGIKLILGDNPPLGATLQVDLEDFSVTKIMRKTNPDCCLCGESPSITKIEPLNYQSEPEIAEHQNFRGLILDVRESEEISYSLDRAVHRPLSKFWQSFTSTKEEEILLVCQQGIRSLALARSLRNQGYRNTYSLKGGMRGLSS